MALLVIVMRDISLIEIINEHHRRVKTGKHPFHFNRSPFHHKFLEENITERRTFVTQMNKRSVITVLHRQLVVSDFGHSGIR